MDKKRHLRENKDFYRLFRSGKRFESPLFRVVVKPNALLYSRWAFIAPKSLDKRSTARNRLRRRAREWIRKHTENTSGRYDAAILFKKAALQAPRQKFYEELDKTIRKIID